MSSGYDLVEACPAAMTWWGLARGEAAKTLTGAETRDGLGTDPMQSQCGARSNQSNRIRTALSVGFALLISIDEAVRLTRQCA